MFLSWDDNVGSSEAAISVLLVEDDADTLGLLCRLAALERNVECVGAFSGAENALVFLRSARGDQRPDVVIMDWSMPGLAAPTAIEEISSLWPEIGVIVFTAHNEPAVHTSARSAGAWKVIEKDGDFDLLFHAVRACAGFNG